jgi:hypothetical protein
MDYLTKWPEVFPAPDQSSATVARLLVEEVVSRHGVPSEILSDRGQAFLSGLMKEVELLLGFHKVNTTAYHPQTNGLVERYNRTLTAMLAKTVEKGGPEWDERLPYVLFAYRASQQASTQESPFYLVYRRDPRLPTPAAMTPKKTRTTTDLKEYGLPLLQKMTEAWELAHRSFGQAQKKQKRVYDQRAGTPTFQEGERVFLFKPAEKTGAARKFARPFHGPYRIAELGTNTAKIRRVDQPEEEPILVSIDRLRRCPEELGDKFWPPDRAKRKSKTAQATLTRREGSVPATPSGPAPGPTESQQLVESSSAAPEDRSDGTVLEAGGDATGEEEQASPPSRGGISGCSGDGGKSSVVGKGRGGGKGFRTKKSKEQTKNKKKGAEEPSTKSRELDPAITCPTGNTPFASGKERFTTYGGPTGNGQSSALSDGSPLSITNTVKEHRLTMGGDPHCLDEEASTGVSTQDQGTDTRRDPDVLPRLIRSSDTALPQENTRVSGGADVETKTLEGHLDIHERNADDSDHGTGSTSSRSLGVGRDNWDPEPAVCKDK